MLLNFCFCDISPNCQKLRVLGHPLEFMTNRSSCRNSFSREWQFSFHIWSKIDNNLVTEALSGAMSCSHKKMKKHGSFNFLSSWLLLSSLFAISIPIVSHGMLWFFKFEGVFGLSNKFHGIRFVIICWMEVDCCLIQEATGAPLPVSQ